MSESPFKRRLRERKRREADPSIAGSLASLGYHVRSIEDSAFHIEACRGHSERKIRFVFGFADKGDIISVSREPVPYRCQREIWQVTPDGRRLVIIKIEGLVK